MSHASQDMKYVAAMVFSALGIWGLKNNVEYSGWLIFLAFLVAL